jgi:hypothetical protein
MANGIRLVVCVVVVLGLVLECAWGLFMPRHIQVRYASAQQGHIVEVNLPSWIEGAEWCGKASVADQYGRLVQCRTFPER